VFTLPRHSGDNDNAPPGAENNNQPGGQQ
jgi:hypothetical protein